MIHDSTQRSTEIQATIDSDGHLDSVADRPELGWARRGDGLDFLRYGSVIEVQIIKDNAPGTSGLMGVQLFRDDG